METSDILSSASSGFSFYNLSLNDIGTLQSFYKTPCKGGSDDTSSTASSGDLIDSDNCSRERRLSDTDVHMLLLSLKSQSL